MPERGSFLAAGRKIQNQHPKARQSPGTAFTYLQPPKTAFWTIQQLGMRQHNP
jgi:hypothetical protein